MTAPQPIGDPASWFSSDDYPWLALQLSHQGLTRTDLIVDRTGAVIGCGVVGSSGHFSLDTKTCAVFRSRARFRPAVDDRGCPIASVWSRPVKWVVSED